MHRFSRGALLATLALAAWTVAGSAEAQPNCNAAGALWSATAPPVNQRHIFCGEIDGVQVKGYHSTQVLPSNVVTGINNIVPIANGIYNATVTFTNNNTKLSTFFPNGCTADQIVTSVVYAANNSTGPAQPWGRYGPSAPPAGGAAYCLDTTGTRFRIRYGLLNTGNVNTAFPAP
jgi:hypothetical protein